VATHKIELTQDDIVEAISRLYGVPDSGSVVLSVRTEHLDQLGESISHIVTATIILPLPAKAKSPSSSS
jgi:hypothetical protein